MDISSTDQSEVAAKVQQKRISSDGNEEIDTKKRRLDIGDVYSADAVKKYLVDVKAKKLEYILDLLLERFFLDHAGNIMDFHGWKKRPPTDVFRQFVEVIGGPELSKLLMSKVPPENVSAKVSSHQQADQLQVQPLNSAPPLSSRQPTNHVSDLFEISRTTTPRSRAPSYNAKTSNVNSPLGAAAYVSRTHGTRQKSISVVYETSIGSQEQIVERAKQEAHVMQRIAELRREGLWSAKRLPKVQEAPRVKAHWDYLLEEMTWLSTDFAQERKWKKAAAKKCARMITKYWNEQESKKDKAERERVSSLRKIASFCAKEIRTFWASAEKLVEFKQQTRLEKKRKQALDMHLNFIVGQTEQYTEWLTEGLKNNDDAEEVASHADSEFVPSSHDAPTDDEETIAKEEKENDPTSDISELELLQQDMAIPFEDLIESLPPEVRERPASIATSSDQEYQGDESEEDFEDTINEEEEQDGEKDHDLEISQLKDEANMTREELLKKYSGAYEDELEEDDDQTISEDRTEEELTEEDNSDRDDEDIGIETLVDPNAQAGPSGSPEKANRREISEIAAGAEQIQPKGNTLSTAKVVTKIPFLLKHTLREYQHIGLDWLVAMYEKKLNGILADEMGLGKTIQTISLLAHLACEKGVWGPHLIVVPTSVMLNWEMEFKKWCPAFKVLTYYGSPKERKAKRQGWTKPNQFHVCITSYKLVVQDHQSFRRKKWRYLILDEAQNIKNFKSQRWQMLLNFNTSRRLLLTGTPLQNNLMELWSLMHFLMPNVFASHRDFKDWFVNPVTGMIEGNQEYNEELVRRLHKILRPFLLRRLKKDVEKQLPQKHEHVIMCRLSKRQRYLYEEFMSLSKTKETLATGNFLSVINVLMQLRKVCNHPDLFETRPTISPFAMEGLQFQTASLATKPLIYDPMKHIRLQSLNLDLLDNSQRLTAFSHNRISVFKATSKMIEEVDSLPNPPPKIPRGKIRLQITTKTTQAAKRESSSQQVHPSSPATLVQVSQNSTITMSESIPSNSGNGSSILKKLTITSGQDPSGNQKVKIPLGSLHMTPTGQHQLELRQTDKSRESSPTPTSLKRSVPSSFEDEVIMQRRLEERKESLRFLGHLNEFRCAASSPYPRDLVEMFTCTDQSREVNPLGPCFSGPGLFTCRNCTSQGSWDESSAARSLIHTPEQVVDNMEDVLDRFILRVPPVASPQIKMHVSHPEPSDKRNEELRDASLEENLRIPTRILHKPLSKMMTQFPELRLIQYDCGKLQTLDTLLWQLKSGGHRALIFTQMSRMLDIFEQFLSYHGHTYLRLDGATKIEQRQSLMERFNADPKIFCFILSTRSGGMGVNLTGADTVIFYDSDWNPTMDAQAQDRCHRIGQTRDVHIYRLISERTVEENILKKAQQKRLLGDLAIEEGNFTTAFFKGNALQDLFGENLQGQGHDLRDMVAQEPTGLDEMAARKEWEAALEKVEDQADIVAAKTSKAEANAELAEFDETVPLDVEVNDGEEKSPAEEELEKLVSELTPIEKFALDFLEKNQDEETLDLMKAAEDEIEQSKKDWELEHLKNMKEAERAAEQEHSDVEAHVTIAREDAYDQVYADGDEVMHLWTPPTPPQDDTDVYVDLSMSLMYGSSLMAESELPPVYVPKDFKRLKLDQTAKARVPSRRKADDAVTIPRSLFDRPPMAILRLRRELKTLRMKGHLVGGPDVIQLQKILNQLGPNLTITPPMTLVAQAQNSKTPQLLLAGLQQENQPDWTIAEEYATLQVIQQIQELPANLVVVSPAHTPNWDLVSDVVSSSSPNFRSTRICRHHYESVVIPREEGKIANISESLPKKAKKQKNQPLPEAIPVIHPPKARPVRTTVLFRQDDNSTLSRLCNIRIETIRNIASRRTPTAKPVFSGSVGKNNPKHIALLQESGINHEVPLTPMEIATNRQERLAREKAKTQAMQAEVAARQKQQLQKMQQQQMKLAQQQQQQQMQVRSQNFVPSSVASSPRPILAPPAPVTAQPTRNQEVEQLAQQLSQAAANFTAASQAQQAQLSINLQRPNSGGDVGPVSATVGFPGPQGMIPGATGLLSKTVNQSQLQAFKNQAIIRTRQLPSQMSAQLQGQTVQLHQLPAPSRLQLGPGGPQVNLLTTNSLQGVQTSTVVSSNLQVTSGQRILTTTKGGQPYLRQATEAERQLLMPRVQGPGQTRQTIPGLGQILQIHPVQTMPSTTNPNPVTSNPSTNLNLKNVSHALTSAPQTVSIPISVAGMNILSSHGSKLTQVPNFPMKPIPISMISPRRLPVSTQVAGQQIPPTSNPVSQVHMQPISQVAATLSQTLVQSKSPVTSKGAQYGTIQILQPSASAGQKLQLQQIQHLIKQGGLVLPSNMTPGSSIVIRPTGSTDPNQVQTSVSLTHQTLQQIKMVPSTQVTATMGKNIIVSGQNIIHGAQMQPSTTPFTLAIRSTAVPVPSSNVAPPPPQETITAVPDVTHPGTSHPDVPPTN